MNIFKKENNYVYVGGKVSWFSWLWFGAFLSMATVAFFQTNWPGVIGCGVISIGSFFFRMGIQLDEKRKRIRYYGWITGISWGKWYPLENFKYIVVSHVQVRSRKSGQETSVFKIFLSSVNIYKQQSIILGEFSDSETAISRANELGNLLKFEVKVNAFK